MKVTIEATSKEIADFAAQIQSQPKENVSEEAVKYHLKQTIDDIFQNIV